NGKGFYDPLVYVLECHRLGIPLLPPSVNTPSLHFTVVSEKGKAAQHCRTPKPGGNSSVPIQRASPAAAGECGSAVPLSFARDLPESTMKQIRVPVLQVKGLTLRTK